MLAVGGTIAVAAAAHTSARAAVPNVLEIVVGNGPFAGTYKPPPSEVICMHAKQQQIYTAAYRNLKNALNGTATQGKNTAHEIGEAALNISNPDDPGAKFGEVLVAFGDRDKNQIRYTVDRAPLTLTIKGKGADIAFQGKTKEGIQLQVTARCLEVEQM
jgi:hypothetical protein